MFYPPMIGYLVIAAVCVLMQLGIARRMIGRNRIIGIRTKHTLSSDESWERGQRAAAPYVYGVAVVAIGHVAALAAVEVFELPRTVGHLLAISGWIIILACCVFIWRAANSAAKATPPEPLTR